MGKKKGGGKKGGREEPDRAKKGSTESEMLISALFSFVDHPVVNTC